MEKEFCTYNQALRLKALGFDEPCFGFWSKIHGLFITNAQGKLNENAGECLAPTFSQAFRWFRENYNMNGYVSPLEDGKSFYYMLHEDISVTYGNRICSLPSKWLSHEEAELACLEKLLEIVEGIESQK